MVALDVGGAHSTFTSVTSWVPDATHAFGADPVIVMAVACVFLKAPELAWRHIVNGAVVHCASAVHGCSGFSHDDPPEPQYPQKTWACEAVGTAVAIWVPVVPVAPSRFMLTTYASGVGGQSWLVG